MSLEHGTRLGPYELLEQVGAGGMGEVYRARDTRLDRTVAIKVLPTEFSENTQYRQRFEREARAASSLNHPHICTVHDVGHEDGVDYLVMEYLEGETLEARLRRGPLQMDEVLRLGVQISDALDKAHRRGLVHRDLKPGNIMLTGSGAKLLDFGLAKNTEALAGSSLTAVPTATSPLTAQGTILGTLHYMAPEQLEGKEADARTDLFGLGVLLYEAITGRRPFQGETQATLIASIMSAEPPPIATGQAMAPPALDHLVRTCLAKDSDDRWQTAHDVMLQLKAIAEGGTQPSVPAPVVSRRKRRERWGWALAALSSVVAIVLAAAHFARPVPDRPVLRSSIMPPEGIRVLSGGPHVGAVTLSPNGRLLTFAASGEDGIPRLWLRRLDSFEATPIPASEQGSYPFWSPDSRFLGFFADGSLKTVPAAGGQVVTVCDAREGRGGTWGKDGVILFTPHWRQRPIHRVHADGGEPVPVTQLDPARNETTHRWPQFLPDGQHFLFLAGSHAADPTSGDNAVFLSSVDSPGATLLLRARSNVVFASGHLLFMQGNTLVAQQFDPDHRELVGEPHPVAEGVRYETGFFQGAFAAARTGLLVYQEGGLTSLRQLVRMDRGGNVVEELLEPGEHWNVHLSPDGKTVAAGIGEPSDVWLLDLERGFPTRFTFGPLGERPQTWSPDGSRLVFGFEEGVLESSWVAPVDGSEEPSRLFEFETAAYVGDWSRDGRFVIFDSINKENDRSDLWVLPLAPEDEPYPLSTTEFDEGQPTFSPDGRWVAYVSDRSGRDELYLRAFPEGTTLRQVSEVGGTAPRWRGDGRELFYLAPGAKLMAVAMEPGPELVVGRPVELFRGVFPGSFFPYDVLPDGQQFLVVRLLEEPGAATITLVTNWTAALPE